MQLTFQTTLTALLLVLLIPTVSVVGFFSYFNTRFTADNLSSQILDQTFKLIDHQIETLLDSASRQSQMDLVILSKRLLTTNTKRLTASDFGWITDYFHGMMKIHKHLTFLSLGLEATGEYCHVRRMPKDWVPSRALTGSKGEEMRKSQPRLTIQYATRDPSGKIVRSEFYLTEDGSRELYLMDPDFSYDPRTRPYYRAAQAAGTPIWTQVYIFNAPPEPGIPGITYATPVLGSDGSLMGVLTADLDIYNLSEFLQTLKIGQTGFAFVVEVRPKGNLGEEQRQVIAYRDPKNFIRIVQRGGQQVHELVPDKELSDPLLRSFMQNLPPTIDFDKIKYPVPLRFIQNGMEYMGGYRPLGGKHGLKWLICIVVPKIDFMGRVDRNNLITAGIGLISLMIATLLSILLSMRISRPLKQLAKETEAIGQFYLQPKPILRTIVKEVDRLTLAVEEMKTSLRSFQKYVPANLVRSLVVSGQEARLGGELKTLTIYFSDIANFTSISEKLPPNVLVELLGEYLSAMSEQILESGGTVDKYMGDGILAFWGAPYPNPQHALTACITALRNQEKLRALREKWKAEGKPLLFSRIGLNTGELIVGNIGGESRLNYTVIGDPVNLASRLENLNKYYNTAILISESTYLLVNQEVVARPLDWVSVKGKTEGILIYELLGLKGEVSQKEERLVELYSAALTVYQTHHWSQAIEFFQRVRELYPKDLPTQLMIKRCKNYQQNPPLEDWDGLWRMQSK